LAFRCSDRDKTAKFFQEALGYKIQTEFDIQFTDGTSCKCIALEPPEKTDVKNLPWIWNAPLSEYTEYHLAPEIFVSSSEDPDSIVSKWVAHRDGVGGIHHVAYMVDSVEETMKEWKEKEVMKKK